MKKIKCPACGSDNIKLEAEITVRFEYDDDGDIEVISDESDIIEGIEDEESYYCHCWDCDMLFDEENPSKRKGANTPADTPQKNQNETLLV